MSPLGLDAYALSAAFAMLVVFPTALRLDHDVPRWLRVVATVAGFVAASSFAMPVGPAAAGVGALWFLATLPHLAYGFVRFLSDPSPRIPHAWAEAASAVGPVVSSIALVTSRWSGTFAGFPEPLATLTITHFHFTFGLLPLTLSALSRRGLGATSPLWGLIFVPPVVGALMAIRPAPLLPSLWEAGATALLAGFAWAWTVGSWRRLSALPARDRWLARAATILFAAAVSLTPVFAWSSAMGAPTFDFGWMLRCHGLSLALSLTTLGILAIRHAPMRGVSLEPSPHPTAAARDVDPAHAFFVDTRHADLGPDGDGRFDRLADALLHYRFYPATVMRFAASFVTEDRAARLGDRIGMCLLVPLFPGLPAIRFPATTVVNLVARSESHAAFGYLTTEAHYGKGAWSTTLTRVDGRVQLTLQSRMTPTHPLALLGLPLYRWFQKRAHAAGIARLAVYTA